MFRFEAANPEALHSSPAGGGDTPAMAAFRQLDAGGDTVPFYAYGGGAGEAPQAYDPALLAHPVVRRVAALYSDLHDALESGPNYPGWRRGVYPTPEVAAIAFGRGTLYLLYEGEALAGAVELNQEPEAAYTDAAWGAALTNEEILVVHTLVVHPAFQGKGAGRALLAEAEALAKARGLAAVRLDTWENNRAGKALYESRGYTFRGTADFGLENLGLKWFHLYEKLL